MLLLRRLIQLYVGLLLYGFSMALIVDAGLGNAPWAVFHQGMARETGIPIGACTSLVGIALLGLWLPLRQRPGVGTISNAILVGTAIDLTLDHVAQPGAIDARVLLLIVGVLVNGVSIGLYIGARLGPGPRDGLMMGLTAMGLSLRQARSAIELTVLAAGAVLGGRVGIGTVVYAAGIGPLAQVFVPRLQTRHEDQGSPR